MADNYLITGYWGEPHVTAENDRGINAAMFGTGRFVLPVGEQFRAEYIGNNTVRLYDGKLMDNGAAAGIPAGTYVDLLIPETGQGMKRNDLIVFQYSQDDSTMVESGIFTVVHGSETSGTAADPELTQEDLLTDEATFDQMALYRVSVSGAEISAPVKLFSVYQRVADHAALKNNPHKVTIAQIGAAPAGYNDKGHFTFASVDALDSYLVSLVASMDNHSQCSFSFMGTSNHASLPFSANHWWVTVRKLHASNYAIIEMESYYHNIGAKARNIMGNGSLLGWEWFNPPMDAGVVYRTTERWGSKAVYVVKLSFTAESFSEGSSMKYAFSNKGIDHISEIANVDAKMISGSKRGPLPSANGDGGLVITWEVTTGDNPMFAIICKQCDGVVANVAVEAIVKFTID